jgi:hypothetical protein
MRWLDAKLNWLIYWHVKRRARNAGISLVWKLPKPVVRWCVVRAACIAEPQEYPGAVSAERMLNALEPAGRSAA